MALYLQEHKEETVITVINNPSSENNTSSKEEAPIEKEIIENKVEE